MSPVTRSALVVLLIIIPDWVGRGQFWYSFWLGACPAIKKAYDSPYGKLILIILAFLVIWLDQRRLTRKREVAHDLTSLKGRTLKLRDDIRAFLASVPKASGYLSTSQEGTIERLSSQASRVMGKLEHGFYLNFEDRTRRIWNEFGQRGVQDRQLTTALTEKKYDQLLTYKAIIDALSRLAECPEALAENPMPAPFPDSKSNSVAG